VFRHTTEGADIVHRNIGLVALSNELLSREASGDTVSPFHWIGIESSREPRCSAGIEICRIAPDIFDMVFKAYIQITEQATGFHLLDGMGEAGLGRLNIIDMNCEECSWIWIENKGQVRTSAQIKRIIVENGTAKGVELEDGTQFMANKAVVSTIDTHQTFLKYVARTSSIPSSST
jgi:hypothetical protein